MENISYDMGVLLDALADRLEVDLECGYVDNSFDHEFGTETVIDFELNDTEVYLLCKKRKGDIIRKDISSWKVGDLINDFIDLEQAREDFDNQI